MQRLEHDRGAVEQGTTDRGRVHDVADLATAQPQRRAPGGGVDGLTGPHEPDLGAADCAGQQRIDVVEGQDVGELVSRVVVEGDPPPAVPGEVRCVAHAARQHRPGGVVRLPAGGRPVERGDGSGLVAGVLGALTAGVEVLVGLRGLVARVLALLARGVEVLLVLGGAGGGDLVVGDLVGHATVPSQRAVVQHHQLSCFVTMPTPEIATTYLAARQRIDDLVRPLPDDDIARPVRACPGWTVHAVVSHLAAIPEWAAAGRIRGLPTDEDTAAQVAELADVPTQQVLDRWAESAPGFAEILAAADIWPAAIDAVTHEHDIRHALGRPGERDADDVRRLAAVAMQSWTPPRPVEVVTPSGTVRHGPGDGEPIRWTSTDFEVLRARLGRRSVRQLVAMDWSEDPSEVLEGLVLFTPAEVDIDE